MCDCWVQRTMTVSPRPFEEILEAKEAEKCFSFCLVMCYLMLVLFVLCLHHVPFATAQMSILVFFYRSSSICQSLSVSFYIPAPNFSSFTVSFSQRFQTVGCMHFYYMLTLLVRLALAIIGCLASSLYITYTHKHTLTYTYTQERERKKRQSKKARQGERKGSGSCRRLGLVSVYCWSWLW